MNRFLSRREKQIKPDVIELPNDRKGIFVPDEDSKKPTKDEDKKIKEVMAHLDALAAKHFTEEQVQYALRADGVDGDVRKAFNLLMVLEDSSAGLLKEFSTSIKMLGAVNRENTTCYLDALLFAMFARLNSFQGILVRTYDDEPRRRLATLLRLWVNMLRSGRLITIDITRELQEALSSCGWPEAAKLKQQDVSEAFTFITDKLELPLLTLKMDLYHYGKEDMTDDHKFVNERLLDVAIPEDLIGNASVSLEECLENYFNNRVEVKRHLSRIGTGQSTSGPIDILKHNAVFVETVELSSTPDSETTGTTPTVKRPSLPQERQMSIFSERKVEFEVEEGEATDPKNSAVAPALKRTRKSSIRKEVLMPAWQFFKLIPWFTQNATQTDAQISAHFALERPVLGICLKRYKVAPDGKASRLDTHVDIPLDIGLPHFVSDENIHDEAEFHRRFKLSLRSVVCHRGVAVDAGHYISLARTDQGDTSEWLRFDDLASTRVATVDINQALRDESPYLLFYQVQPIDPDPEEYLPPYEEHEVPFDTLDQKLGTLSINGRTSNEISELTQSARTSIDASEGRGRSPNATPRRGSIAWTDTSQGTGPRVDITPCDPLGSKEGSVSSVPITRHGSRLSRRRDESKSRQTSANGDNRLSLTLSRMVSRASGAKPSNTDTVVNDTSANSNSLVPMAAQTNTNSTISPNGSQPISSHSPLHAPPYLSNSPPPPFSEKPIVTTRLVGTVPVEPKSAATTSVTALPTVPSSGLDRSKSKRKSKSKDRTRFRSQKPATSGKAPDRECSVM